MRNITVILTVLALLIIAAVPAFAQDAPGSIVDIAVNDGRFNTLVAAVTAAGLADTLAGEGDFTVFAPTDDAFAMLPEGTVEALLGDIPTLTDILLYHVVPGSVYAADVVTLSSATMANGLPVSIEASDMGVMLNGSTQVIITDIQASNGVIHVIDSVLLPPFSVSNDNAFNINFRTGPSLQDSRIGAFPPEARAAAMGRDDSGEWVKISYDGAEGWVFAELTTPSGDVSSLEVVRGTIAEVAAEAGSFNTLLAAVGAAGLGDALNGEGPLTVFAPTDDAFAALPEGTVEALLADIPALTNILTYHVVPGAAYAADVVGLDSVTSLQGSAISITVNDDGVFLNDSAQVIVTDIMASNGVIHVINAVILPPQ